MTEENIEQLKEIARLNAAKVDPGELRTRLEGYILNSLLWSQNAGTQVERIVALEEELARVRIALETVTGLRGTVDALEKIKRIAAPIAHGSTFRNKREEEIWKTATNAIYDARHGL